MPVLLSEQDVRIVLPMGELIDAMEAALARFSANDVGTAAANGVEVGLQKAFVGVMPAFIAEPAALGTKVVRCSAAIPRSACRPTSRPSSCSTR